MPKQLTAISIYTCAGDQHGETYRYAWSNNCGEFHYIDDTDPETYKALKNQGYSRGIQSSDLTAIKTKLLQYIQSGDAYSLESLLKTDYIYPRIVFHGSPESTDHRKGDWYDSRANTYYTRPIVEAFFFENNSYFRELINALLEANNNALYFAFVHSLLETDLTDEMLFSWDKNTRGKSLEHAVNMFLYCESLATKESDEVAKDKGAKGEEIAKNLVTRIKAVPVVDNENASLGFKPQFEILKFKLDLAKDLHEADETFSTHRGWKRFAVNACTLLFTAGLLNIANRLVGSKNWLFFNKTTTEEKVANVDSAMGFKQHEAINFKP